MHRDTRSTHENLGNIGICKRWQTERHTTDFRATPRLTLVQHKTTLALLMHDQVVSRQQILGLDDRDATDTIVSRQLSLCRKCIAGGKFTGVNSCPQRHVDLVILRQWIHWINGIL